MWLGDGSAHAMATPAVEIKKISNLRCTLSLLENEYCSVENRCSVLTFGSSLEGFRIRKPGRQEGGARCSQRVELGPLPSVLGQADPPLDFSCVLAFLISASSYRRGPVMTFNISTHDSYPPEETALVDRGLGEANDAAAPLHEVRPLSCFAHGGRRCSWRRCGSLVGPMLRITTTLGRAFISPSRHRNSTGPSLRSSSSGARLVDLLPRDVQFPDAAAV
jgi:hypothetical protein